MVPKKIMVVDDAALMRHIIRNLLDQDPNLAVVALATDGRDALRQLESVKLDLILLDIEMPHMDGLEFLCHARLKSQAKVVILSAVSPAGSQKAAMARNLGADAVISKPSGAVSFDLVEKTGSQLKAVIYQILGIHNINTLTI